MTRDPTPRLVFWPLQHMTHLMKTQLSVLRSEVEALCSVYVNTFGEPYTRTTPPAPEQPLGGVDDEMDDAPRGAGGRHDSVDDRNRRNKERNRLHARKSRQRRKVQQEYTRACLEALRDDAASLKSVSARRLPGPFRVACA